MRFKNKAVLLFLISIIIVMFSTHTLARTVIQLKVDGRNIATDTPPQVIDGRVLIPIRSVAEALGKSVTWDNELKEVRIENETNIIAQHSSKNIKIIGTKYNDRYIDLKIETESASRTLEGMNVVNTAYAPQIYVLDLNDDDRDEIVVILTTGYGTGALQTEVLVLEERTLSYEIVENPVTYMMKHGKTNISDREIDVEFNDQKITIPTERIATPKEKWFANISLQNQIQYFVEDDTLKAIIAARISPTEGIGTYEVDFSYKDGFYQVDSVDFTNWKESNSVTEHELQHILNELVPKAVDMYGMFNGSGYFKIDETKTMSGEDGYALVFDENVKSVKDIKKVVENVFKEEIAQQIFYDRYLYPPVKNARPLYKEYKGQLYVDTRNGGHGWATEFLIDTAKVVSQKENIVEIELDMTVLDDPYGTITIVIENINGKWYMASRLD